MNRLRMILLLAVLPLAGCPWTVNPRQESQCDDVPNCGQCASEAVCVWNLELAACQGASLPAANASVIVTQAGECPPPSDPRTHR